jgi:hypothetical protein
LFFFVRFLSPRPTKTARPIIFTIYTSNDAVSRKKVPFEVPTLLKTSKGLIFPNPQILAGNRDFQLKQNHE